MNAKELKQDRLLLKLSQSRLARLAGLPRFKIAFYELGDRDLSEQDQAIIRRAMEEEATRLQRALAPFSRRPCPLETTLLTSRCSHGAIGDTCSVPDCDHVQLIEATRIIDSYREALATLQVWADEGCTRQQLKTLLDKIDDQHDPYHLPPGD